MKRFVAIGLACVVAGPIAGSRGSTSQSTLTPSTITAADLGEVRFREVGPAAMGGRIASIAVVEQNARTIYVGAASGGVWKTEDAGATWKAIFDQAPVSAIGAVTVAPSDPSVVWVGTGEANSRENSGWGNGVYVSRDAGTTWRHAGLDDTRHIGRIAVDRRNPDRALVAALGPIWRRGGQRGIFKTQDGGRTWRHVLSVDDETGAIDVILHPHDAAIAFASTYRTATPVEGRTQQTRWPRGEKRNRLYRSTDGGDTWAPVAGGFPDDGIGRIAIDIYRNDPRIVVALVEGERGGVYRSEDGGLSWIRTNATVRGTSFICEIRIDPNDDRRIWVAGADPLYYSGDAGKTFCSSEGESHGTTCEQWLERLHFDTHAIWINPGDSRHMLTGNDGGLYQSFSGAMTWDYLNTIPLAQFHQVAYDLQKPYHVYGGQQDTGTWSGPSRSMHTIGITNDDWFGMLVGDGYYVWPDPVEPWIVYAQYQGGRLFRIDRRTNERRDIRPASRAGAPPYRIESGNHPILVSLHDRRRLYLGGNRLFISENRGDRWRETDDLTRDPSGTGVITTIDESPKSAGLLWVGTSDGLVRMSRDAGATWTDVTPSDRRHAPLHVSRVIASNAVEGRAYVTYAGHWRGDETPYVYTTDDFGRSWRSLRANLPQGHVPMVLREHPGNSQLLFLGTEMGLWASWSRGERWTVLGLGVPALRIHDLHIHPRDNDLIVGTHGRGIFILDDIAGIAGLTSETLQRPLAVFKPRDAVTWRLFNHRANLGPGHRIYVAQNPPEGVVLSYFLRDGLPRGGTATVEFSEASGRVVRTLQAPASRGLNRVVWDLRHGTPFEAPAGIRPDPPGQPGGPRMRALALSQGPFVLPGIYTARISVAGHQATTTVSVQEDERLQLTPAALRAHRDAWHRLTALWVDGNALVKQLDAVTDALETRQLSSEVSATLKTQLAKSAADVIDRRRKLAGARASDQSLYREFLDPGTRFDGPLVPRIGQLLLSVSTWTGAPTDQQIAQTNEQSAALDRAISEWRAFVTAQLRKVNEALTASGLATIVLPEPITRTRSRP